MNVNHSKIKMMLCGIKIIIFITYVIFRLYSPLKIVKTSNVSFNGVFFTIINYKTYKTNVMREKKIQLLSSGLKISEILRVFLSSLFLISECVKIYYKSGVKKILYNYSAHVSHIYSFYF